jgi:hypothetical protein
MHTGALGQAKLGNLGSAVFFPDARVEEDRGDILEVVTRTLTEVVGEAKVGDQLAGLSVAKLRVLGETAVDGDVDAHLDSSIGLWRFVPRWLWRAQRSGSTTLQGSGGRKLSKA